jgi:hypothetical protein
MICRHMIGERPMRQEAFRGIDFIGFRDGSPTRSGVEIEHRYDARSAEDQKLGARSDLPLDLLVASSKHFAEPLDGFLTFSARCALARHLLLEHAIKSLFCWPGFYAESLAIECPASRTSEALYRRPLSPDVSENQHGVAIAVEAVFSANCLGISGADELNTCESTDQDK